MNKIKKFLDSWGVFLGNIIIFLGIVYLLRTGNSHDATLLLAIWILTNESKRS